MTLPPSQVNIIGPLLEIIYFFPLFLRVIFQARHSLSNTYTDLLYGLQHEYLFFFWWPFFFFILFTLWNRQYSRLMRFPGHWLDCVCVSECMHACLFHGKNRCQGEADNPFSEVRCAFWGASGCLRAFVCVHLKGDRAKDMTSSRWNVFRVQKGGAFSFSLSFMAFTEEISHRIKFRFHYCGAQLDPIPAFLSKLVCVKLAVILAKWYCFISAQGVFEKGSWRMRKMAA